MLVRNFIANELEEDPQELLEEDNAAGTVQPGTVVSAATDGGFVQLNVVCMQSEHDIPTRGTRYFSVSNAAEGPVQTCQKQCGLDESANIQSCVWQCEQ